MITYHTFSWRRGYRLNNIFVIRVIEFIGLVLITFLKSNFVEAILMADVNSVA